MIWSRLVPRDPLVDPYFWVLRETNYYKNSFAYPIGPADSPFSHPGSLFHHHDGLREGVLEAKRREALATFWVAAQRP